MDTFAAHIIMATTWEGQTSVFVWENIVIFSAPDGKGAFEKAKEYGASDAAAQADLTCDGQPAKMIFLGVRKVISCVDPLPAECDGIEVTYHELVFSSMDDAKRYASGEPVLPVAFDADL
jgi:Domain of unknown function (DUF4288)